MTEEMFNRDRKWVKRVEDERNCRGPRKRCCDVERSPERSTRCVEVTVEEDRRRIRETPRPYTRPYHLYARDAGVTLSPQNR
jgi:hypothetical protein